MLHNPKQLLILEVEEKERFIDLTMIDQQRECRPVSKPKPIRPRIQSGPLRERFTLTFRYGVRGLHIEDRQLTTTNTYGLELRVRESSFCQRVGWEIWDSQNSLVGTKRLPKDKNRLIVRTVSYSPGYIFRMGNSEALIGVGVSLLSWDFEHRVDDGGENKNGEGSSFFVTTEFGFQLAANVYLDIAWTYHRPQTEPIIATFAEGCRYSLKGHQGSAGIRLGVFGGAPN